MKKWLTVLFLVEAASLLRGGETLVRYHFTTNETGTIVAVNRANPGTWDATAGSYGIVADKATVPWGTDVGNMPKYDNGFHEIAPNILEQTRDADGEIVPTGGALKWEGVKVQGGLLVDQTTPFRPGLRTIVNEVEKYHPYSIEAYVKLPPEAATRTNEMFPIAMVGNDMKRGWIFSIYKGRPFFRWCWKKADGTVTANNHTGYQDLPTTDLPSLYDGRWHRVALTFVDAGSQACARTYIDGAQVGAQRVTLSTSGWNGLYYGEDGDDVPFVIGGHPYQNGRTYMGEIAELKITEGQLTDNRFQIAVPAGPVDADTAVMLQLGENASRFGYAAHHFTKFKTDNTNYYYIARNWNLENAATNNVLQPRWFSYDDVTVERTRAATTEGAPGSVIRAESTAGVSFPDATSLTFAPNTDKADVINIPGAGNLATNDFTIEFFYKTTTTTTRTILCSGAAFLSKLCVHNGQLLLRVVNEAGSTAGGDMTTTNKVNDGMWHHAAFTYRKDTGLVRFFSDYRFSGQKQVTLRAAATTFFVGGVDRTSQVFDGSIDNLRITRRVLHVGEFLRASQFVSSKCLDVSFDTPDRPWASGQDASIVPDGEAFVSLNAPEGTEPPTLVASRAGWVLDGENGPRIREGGQALRVDNGYVYWSQTPTMEREAWTFEFFSKMQGVRAASDTELFKLTYGNVVGNVSVCKVVFRRKDAYGGDRLILFSAPSTNDLNCAGSNTQVKICEVTLADILDSKWHHWAFTMEQQNAPSKCLKLVVLRDYEVLGQASVAGRVTFPQSGAGCSFSIGSWGDGIHATYDDVRVSPGVLSVDQLLRFEPKQGLTLLVR